MVCSTLFDALTSNDEKCVRKDDQKHDAMVWRWWIGRHEVAVCLASGRVHPYAFL